MTASEATSTAAAFFQERRKAAGLTQRQVAEHAGVTPGYIAKIENGREVPSKPETIEALARAIGVDPYTLYYQFQRIPPEITSWMLEDEDHMREAGALRSAK